MEREKFFSFGLVRLYRLDSPTTVASLVSVLCLHKKIFALSGVSTFHFFWLYQLKIASCFSLPIYLSQKEIDTALVRFVSNFSKVFLVQLLLKKKVKKRRKQDRSVKNSKLPTQNCGKEQHIEGGKVSHHSSSSLL